MSFWQKLFGGKPKLMDWRDFCQHFADAANREPGVSAVIEWADTPHDTYIAFTAEGETESGRLYVANAYAQYSQDPDGLDGLLAAHLTAMRQMASAIQESAAIESGQIRITLKNASWLDEMRELNGPSTEELPLCEPLAGDILLVYMLDLSTAMRSMTQADADKLGLSDRTKLRETALDNIRRLIRQDGLETDRAEGRSLCQIRLDGFYDTALVLLLDEILHDDAVLAANSVFAVGELFLTDGCQQFLYRFSGQRFAAQHHFEAVVVGRVVAAGNHHAAAAAFFHGGKIQHGGGYHADVGYVHAAVGQSANQAFQ